MYQRKSSQIQRSTEVRFDRIPPQMVLLRGAILVKQMKKRLLCDIVIPYILVLISQINRKEILYL